MSSLRATSPFSGRSLASDDDCQSNSSGVLPFGLSSGSSASSTGESRVVPLGAPKASRGEVQPHKFKTQLCAHFVRGEQCPYDPWCAFAHGEEELRSVEGNVVEGVTAVNTLPRTLIYHEAWVQTTKYVRKTGPAAPTMAAAAPPRPSFMRGPKAVSEAQPFSAAATSAKTVRRHEPYAVRVFA